MSRDLRIGVTGMSPAGEVDDPYAGVNLAAAENPNFVDGMNHWAWNHYYDPAIRQVGTLPMEFTPDPTITTGCLVDHANQDPYPRAITQDMIAIPGDMRASLPCDFTTSHWRLQVGNVEGRWMYFQPGLSWFDADGVCIASLTPPFAQITDIHAWQYDSFTVTVPATAYYLGSFITYQVVTGFDMYYTATKLERVSPGPPALNLESFAISRDASGILLAVRDNAAPQFAVSKDAGGIMLGAWR